MAEFLQSPTLVAGGVPSIFILGDLSRPEFRLTRDWLRSQATPICGDRSRLDVPRGWDRETDPDAILLVQSRPGEYPPSLVDHLRRRYPLSPIVVVLGSWCEGETRSGQPLESTWRFAWYDFVPRMSAAWQHVPAGHPSRLHRPLLMSDAERWSGDLRCQIEFGDCRVGVICGSHSQFESLRDTLIPYGFQVVRCVANRLAAAREKAQLPQVLLWDDAAAPRDADPGVVATIERNPPQIPSLVLLTFPRVQHVERLYACGVQGVLPKPFDVSDLLWHLHRLVGQTHDVVTS